MGPRNAGGVFQQSSRSGSPRCLFPAPCQGWGPAQIASRWGRISSVRARQQRRAMGHGPLAAACSLAADGWILTGHSFPPAGELWSAGCCRQHPAARGRASVAELHPSCCQFTAAAVGRAAAVMIAVGSVAWIDRPACLHRVEQAGFRSRVPALQADQIAWIRRNPSAGSRLPPERSDNRHRWRCARLMGQRAVSGLNDSWTGRGRPQAAASA